MAEMIKAWPYWPIVRHPTLRRILPGIAISSLGDGMGMVAVAWLALQLAPGTAQGLWVAAAVAAYSLPGVLGGLALSRLLATRAAARLAGWNAALRAAALGTAAAAAAAGALGPASYVGLLAVSSLLAVWGRAGTLTLIAETLADEHRLAGNALFSMLSTTGFIAGPAIAGLLVVVGGPALVIGIDAVTFAVLALSYLLAISASGRAGQGAGGHVTASAGHSDAVGVVGEADRAASAVGVTGEAHRAASAVGVAGEAGRAAGSRPSGFRIIGADRQLLGLTVLSFVFFLLYGPVEVALPIHVHHDLHGSAALLGAFWTLFATGEVIGGLAAPYLRRWKPWPVVSGVVLGWGVCLLPTGIGGSAGLALIGFGAGGFIYAPYPAIQATLIQRISPPRHLAAVLAAQGAITVLAPSIGVVLGGPLVTGIGARPTLLLSATATIALGLATGLGVAVRKVPPARSTVADAPKATERC